MGAAWGRVGPYGGAHGGNKPQGPLPLAPAPRLRSPASPAKELSGAGGPGPARSIVVAFYMYLLPSISRRDCAVDGGL
jgi:hypothetical protein